MTQAGRPARCRSGWPSMTNDGQWAGDAVLGQMLHEADEPGKLGRVDPALIKRKNEVALRWCGAGKLLFSTPSAMPRNATAVPRSYSLEKAGKRVVGDFGVNGHAGLVTERASPSPEGVVRSDQVKPARKLEDHVFLRDPALFDVKRRSVHPTHPTTPAPRSQVRGCAGCETEAADAIERGSSRADWRGAAGSRAWHRPARQLRVDAASCCCSGCRSPRPGRTRARQP